MRVVLSSHGFALQIFFFFNEEDFLWSMEKFLEFILAVRLNFV